jgi:hypothetical protein
MALAVMPETSSKPGPLQLLTPAHAVERRDEAVKLYYRVLEAMLRGEAVASGTANFTPLLSSATFHTCLLSCAFEMVVAAYHMATLQVWLLLLLLLPLPLPLANKWREGDMFAWLLVVVL